MMANPQSFGTRLVRAIRRFQAQQRVDSLRDLDPGTLADIGVHPSEIGSIDAEAAGRSTLTRRRILVEAGHA